jgi:hypothetical protein
VCFLFCVGLLIAFAAWRKSKSTTPPTTASVPSTTIYDRAPLPGPGDRSNGSTTGPQQPAQSHYSDFPPMESARDVDVSSTRSHYGEFSTEEVTVGRVI